MGIQDAREALQEASDAYDLLVNGSNECVTDRETELVEDAFERGQEEAHDRARERSEEAEDEIRDEQALAMAELIEERIDYFRYKFPESEKTVVDVLEDMLYNLNRKVVA